MTLRYTKRSLPRQFTSHPSARKVIVFEKDLRIGTSRLRAKLLVFRSCKALQHFWKHGLNKSNLGRYCRGAVNGLGTEVLTMFTDGTEKRHLEADPRYFCVIGLVKGFLNMEIIAHESVHAGFCYARRIKRSPWDAAALDFDEEAVCYPAGAIARAINRAVYSAKLYG